MTRPEPGSAGELRAARAFADRVAGYRTSPGHASGPDLEAVAAAVAGTAGPVLDVATGAGHTALRVAATDRWVVATDAAVPMVAATRSAATGRRLPVVVAAAAACALPFPAGVFGAVTCRIAPHHFTDVPAAVAEMARVVRPGGTVVIEDSVAPEEPTAAAALDDIERWRDPTHVRTLTADQWRRTVEGAGLRVLAVSRHPKRHDLAAWLARTATPPEVGERVRARLAGLPTDAAAALGVELADGQAVAFTDHKLVIVALR